jgi:hypothetical protein
MFIILNFQFTLQINFIKFQKEEMDLYPKTTNKQATTKKTALNTINTAKAVRFHSKKNVQITFTFLRIFFSFLHKVRFWNFYTDTYSSLVKANCYTMNMVAFDGGFSID